MLEDFKNILLTGELPAQTNVPMVWFAEKSYSAISTELGAVSCKEENVFAPLTSLGVEPVAVLVKATVA